MKNILSLLIAILLVVLLEFPAIAQSPCYAQNQTQLAVKPSCNSNPLILVFEDNFDGNTLDLTKWNAINTVQRDPTHQNENQWYQPENLTVYDGTLKIWTRKEVPAVAHSYYLDGIRYDDVFDYTSGEIDSKTQFGDGYFEIRCKIPKGKGFWPAFWGFAYGHSMDEIDVFEFHNESILGIYDPYKLSKYPNFDLHNNAHYGCSSDYSPGDCSQDFYVFGVYRDQYRITWKINGQDVRSDYYYYTYDSQNQIYLPVTCDDLQAGNTYYYNSLFPRDPMTIIANLAIQYGNNNGPNSDTPFPSAFEIDYIKWYKQLPCAVQPIAISALSVFPAPGKFPNNSYYGTSVWTTGTVSLLSGTSLNLKSEENITLNPGFNGNSGSNFVGQIQPCPERAQRVGALNSLIQSTDVNTASTASGKGENQVNIFPNPTSGKLNFEVNFKEEKTMEFSILSPLGKEILKADLGKVKTAFQEIDLSNQPDGIYLIRIKSDNDITYKKIILSK